MFLEVFKLIYSHFWPKTKSYFLYFRTDVSYRLLHAAMVGGRPLDVSRRRSYV